MFFLNILLVKQHATTGAKPTRKGNVMSHTPIFTGSATALVTPFDDRGVDFETMGKLIDFQIANGTDGIVMCGTTGEAVTMHDNERAESIAFAKKRAAGRVPIIAGTGTNETPRAIALSKAAYDAGADALLVVTPYYNKTSQRGLVKYFYDVADATPLPNIVYNVPSRTSLNIQPKTLAELAKHPQIIGIKEASSDICQIMEMARLCPDFDIYSGCDDHVLAILAAGGKGVITTVGNIIPKLVHDMCAAFFAGDVAESRRLQFYMNPLVNAVFSDVNPIPIKTALRHMGYSVGELRPPLCDMAPEAETALVECMKTYGLI